MKSSKLLLAIAAGSLWVGSAQAALLVDNWTLDANAIAGEGLSFSISGINSITYHAVAHAVSTDANSDGIPDIGDSFNTTGYGYATGFFGSGGSPLNNYLLNQTSPAGWELTFAWTAGGTFIPPSAGSDRDFTHTATGSIAFYAENLTSGTQANFNNAASFTGGTKIAQFDLLAGEGGVLHLATFDGADDANFLIDMANTLSGVLLSSGGTDLSTLATLGMHSDSNFDSNPNQTQPAGFNLTVGAFNCGQTATDFCATEDGSNVLTVPEPGSLALMGLGLMGLAAGIGRRRIRT